MQRRTVAIYCRDFLTRSMTFVYAHVRQLERFRPVVLTTRRLHADLFPVRDLHRADPWTTAERLLSRLTRPLSGEFPTVGGAARRQWERALEENPPALIHAHFGPGGLDMLPLARRLGVPLVVTIHGYDGSQLLDDRRYRRALRTLTAQAAAVICVCEPMRDRIVAAAGGADRVHVRHLGTDTDRFATADRRDRTGPVRILQLAGLTDKKGIPTALRAFAAARKDRDDLRFVLAGEGPRRDAILALARELDLGASFEYRGPVTHEDAPGLMAEVDVFVQPSEVTARGDREGLPTAIMEAMSTGLPVLSTRHEGIPELVLDGETGVLVGEGDVAGLAAAMIDLAASAEQRRRWGAAGAARVREQFDLRRKVAEMEDFYEEILSRS